MRLQSFYPIVVTEHLIACRDFYRRWFGLEVVFEFQVGTRGPSMSASRARARRSPCRSGTSPSVSGASASSTRPACGSTSSSRSSPRRAGGTSTWCPPPHERLAPLARAARRRGAVRGRLLAGDSPADPAIPVPRPGERRRRAARALRDPGGARLSARSAPAHRRAGHHGRRDSSLYPRLDPHRGIDVKGHVGADVLAVAEGRVTVARDNQDLCGLIVVVVHDPHGYRTVYCHLAGSP